MPPGPPLEDPCGDDVTVMTLFGPESFERVAGQPNIFEAGFEVVGPGVVCIRVTNHGLASASIDLDGEPLFVPSDFNPHVEEQVVRLELAEGPHLLTLRLTSGPGQFLDLEVRFAGECRDARPVPSDPAFIADRYLALAQGDEESSRWGILRILETPDDSSDGVVRRAVTEASGDPICHYVKPLTRLLANEGASSVTRALSATALGLIARRAPCVFPGGDCAAVHDPLAAFARSLLFSCLEAQPQNAIRRSCIEATGLAGLVEATDDVLAVLEDPSVDPIVRLCASRACTLLTGELCRDEAVNQAVVDLVVRRAFP